MKKTMPNEEYLRIKDIAKLIDVAPYTLIKAIQDDALLIPYTKIKRGTKRHDVFFLRKDVQKFIHVPWRKKNVKSKSKDTD
jgi:hypothetical protein